MCGAGVQTAHLGPELRSLSVNVMVGPMPSRLLPAPPLPPWLEEELPFNRRLFEDGGHSIHFVDHGEGPPVLLQHGNPTWCYLWRKVIRILVRDKVRVIAPDLVGLGLSSKPRELEVHTLDFHADRSSSLVRALDLRDITVVGQDWGGPIVAVTAARNRERVRGAVFANTAIRVPSGRPRRTPFHRFSKVPLVSDLLFRVFNFPLPLLAFVQGNRSSIGRVERRAYSYPLRKISDRAAPLALARLVPTSLDEPVIETLREVEDWAHSFTGPIRLVWGMRDPILKRAVWGARKLFPDAEVVETEAGHFLQEEVPEALAAAILDIAMQSP